MGNRNPGFNNKQIKYSKLCEGLRGIGRPKLKFKDTVKTKP